MLGKISMLDQRVQIQSFSLLWCCLILISNILLRSIEMLGIVALVKVNDERGMDRVLGIVGIQLVGINNHDVGL